MAAFATPWPFRGIMQMKYEQLLDTNPEWVKEVSNEELTSYLRKVQDRYVDRRYEVMMHLVDKHSTGPGHTLPADGHLLELYTSLEMQADEIAREEALGL